MGIKIPGYHLKSKHDLPSFRRRLQAGFGGRKISAELNLTSLIDLFSVLILYLISTFSATGEIMVIQKELKVPTAKHAKLLQRSPIVTVTAQGISLEGKGADKNDQIEKVTEENWDMPILKDRLRAYKARFESVQPGIPFPGNIIVQADRSLDFVYLKRVLYNLVAEGYTGINLVVRGEPITVKAESR
jgi:biopolymer transport protein ExbD